MTMTTLKCEVITLPTEKADIGTIMKYIKKMPLHDNNIGVPIGGFVINKNHFVNGKNEFWEPQHLYLVSDREIKEGDWFINTVQGTIYYNDIEGYNTDKPYLKKIEATTDPLLMNFDKRDNDYIIPQIHQSFSEAFVKSKGKMTEVQIELENDGHGIIRVKTRSDNTVIVN